jgi:hypothetical protein
LGRYSKAPPWKAETAESRSEIRRHDDHRQARQPGLHLAQQVDARPTGHADVGDQHLRLVVVQRGQHVARVAEAAGGELLARQRLLQHESDGLVVVYDPDGFHAAAACFLGWRAA